MAGSEEENPAMSSEDISLLIRQSGFVPVERDSLYNPV
jgi:2-iminoacetate synthase ThiH